MKSKYTHRNHGDGQYSGGVNSRSQRTMSKILWGISPKRTQKAFEELDALKNKVAISKEE